MKNYFEYFLFLIIKSIFSFLPWKFYPFLSKLFGSLIFQLLNDRRKIAISNLKFAFPEFSIYKINEIAKKSFQNVTLTVMEVLALPNWGNEKISEIIKLENPEVLNMALQKGKGIILVGGHYANWELIIPCCTVVNNFKLSTVVLEQRNPFVNNFLDEIRTKNGNETITLDKAPKKVLQHLSENKIIAILGDQSGKEDGLYTKFFGRKTSTHKGPAVFALRTNAELLFMENIRLENGKCKLTFVKIDYSDIDPKNENAIELLTERITKILENHIIKYPEQWLWMHKRWKHTIN